ncbi:hypothetical protein [Caproicibacter fermentans]|uniref:Uncharacterized protein n=1 Tax=Caproicibacter fermentans TaxID=2576756 RepID=A0A7G8TF64_9FIRM|nr:hypothetical protein [Caproicibacter fermentans]QNK42255.1 hypothetical protein HCR03_08630 [Caproicibacter fermentans]
MDKVKATITLCGLDFRKWISSSRIKIILLLIVLMIYNYLQGVRSFTNAVHVSVTPWSLPFLMTTFNSLIIVMLGFVFLYCDAPFLDEQQPYLILRVGREIFSAAQILYVFVSSLTYTIFIFIMTVFCSLPRVEFSLKWGKIFKTLAVTDASSQYNVLLNIPESLMVHESPLTAIAKELLLLWLVGCFLGFLIFALNMHFPRAVGVGCASLLVFLDMFADFYRQTHGYSGNLIYFFSPVSWANLTVLKSDPAEVLPTFAYTCSVLILLVAILIFFIFIMFRRKTIEVLPQI